MGKLTSAWFIVLMTGMASMASGPPSDGATSPSPVVDNAYKRQIVVRAFKVAVLVPIIDLLHSRHVRFKRAAAHHRLRCAAWGACGLNGVCEVMYDFESRRILDLRQFDIETDYHFEMCEKYKFAADQPWLPVLPDPPPPQRSPRGESSLDPSLIRINPAKTKTPTYDAFRRRLADVGVIPAVGIE